MKSFDARVFSEIALCFAPTQSWRRLIMAVMHKQMKKHYYTKQLLFKKQNQRHIHIKQKQGRESQLTSHWNKSQRFVLPQFRFRFRTNNVSCLFWEELWSTLLICQLSLKCGTWPWNTVNKGLKQKPQIVDFLYVYLSKGRLCHEFILLYPFVFLCIAWVVQGSCIVLWRKIPTAFL